MKGSVEQRAVLRWLSAAIHKKLQRFNGRKMSPEDLEALLAECFDEMDQALPGSKA